MPHHVGRRFLLGPEFKLSDRLIEEHFNPADRLASGRPGVREQLGVEGIVDDIPRYQELGATYLYLAFFNFARTYAEMAGMMERFARDVKLV